MSERRFTDDIRETVMAFSADEMYIILSEGVYTEDAVDLVSLWMEGHGFYLIVRPTEERPSAEWNHRNSVSIGWETRGHNANAAIVNAAMTVLSNEGRRKLADAWPKNPNLSLGK